MSSGEIEDFPPITNDSDKNVSRSIEYVINKETGEEINADEFFEGSSAEDISKISRKLIECDKDGVDYIVCGKCKTRVKVGHRIHNGSESLFFVHTHIVKECSWSKLSESPRIPSTKKDSAPEPIADLIDVKSKIFELLTSDKSKEYGISNVEREKTVKGTVGFMKWRRADFSFNFQGHRVVIEIQDNSSSLDEIVKKDDFYKLNGIYVIWLFGSGTETRHDYLRYLSYKTTLFDNHLNVFVFDKVSLEQSDKKKMLIFKCNWLNSEDKWHYNLSNHGQNGVLISLNDLTFEEDKYKPYYFDANKEYFKKHPEQFIEFEKTQLTREDLLKKVEEEWISSRSYEDAITYMQRNNKYAEKYRNGNLWGFRFNTTTLIQPVFSVEPKLQTNGYYKVQQAEKLGIVDRLGRKVVDWNGTFSYYDIFYDSESEKLFVSNDGLWGIANKNGKIIINYKFQEIASWTKDTFRVKRDNKWGLCDLNGNEKVPCKYITIGQLINNKAKAEVLSSNGWTALKGELDENGSVIKEKTEQLNGNIIGFYCFERWGISDQNRIIVNPIYEDIKYWGEESLYLLKLNGKWGVLNIETKEFVLPIKYEEIGLLSNGKAVVKFVGQESTVNSKGHKISQEEIQLLNGLKKIRKSGKWGIVDANDKVIVDFLYDEIGSFRSRMIGIINGRIIKLNVWYNYPILIKGKMNGYTTSCHIIDVAGVSCYLSRSIIKNLKSGVGFCEKDLCEKLAFSNLMFSKGKYFLRICEINQLSHQISHGDKDTDFMIGEKLDGQVNAVKKYKKVNKEECVSKVIVSFMDGRKTMVPKRYFKCVELDIMEYTEGTKITLEKIGFDDELDQTIWKIIPNSYIIDNN